MRWIAFALAALLAFAAQAAPRAVLELGRDGQATDWADRLQDFVRAPGGAPGNEARYAKSA